MSSVLKFQNEVAALDKLNLIGVDELCFDWLRVAIMEAGGHNQQTLLTLLAIIKKDM